MSKERESLLDALDLPSGLRPIQDAYWDARRDWAALSEAYELVLRDLIRRQDDE